MMKQTRLNIPFRLMTLLVVFLLLSVGAMAQSITVQGHVKDSSGEPIIGATVRVAGASGGTVTDYDGNFTIKANAGATLNVTYVGYQPATARAAARVVVTLQDDSQMLESVVVIGYGVAKKNDLTGSVTAIKPDEKNKGLQVTAQDMIQGKIAGVNVNSNDGSPGGGAQILIRGGASLSASNKPLIVIDGMAMDNNDTKGMSNPLSLVNPADIESFTVLKDASATAIYGSRGSNGVIIITTKKGRKNQKAHVSYNGTFSVSTVAKKLDLMNASEYANQIKNYYGENSTAYQGLGWREYNADGTPNYAAGTYDTDWQDEIYRAGISHDHNLTVTGGAGGDSWSMPYRVSVGYTNQNGVLKGSDFKRVTAGLTLNPTMLEDHLTMNINGKYAYSKSHPGGTDAIGEATIMDPTRPVTSADEKYKGWGGYYEWADASSAYDPTFPYARNENAPRNPVELINNESNHYKDALVLLGNVEADYKIHGFEDLHLHVNLAGEYADGGEFSQYSPYSTSGYYYGSVSNNVEKKYNLLATAYAQYVKDFNKANHFDLMAGYEYSRMKYWGNERSYGMYPDTNTSLDANGNPNAGQLYNEQPSQWKGQVVLVSWFGRLNYSLLDRYLFTFTARYDGSSRFADGHRWGFFPSAAFAWRIKDEPFLKNVDAVSDLKLRLGWGKTGQQDTGKEYYTATYQKTEISSYLYPVGPDNNGQLYQPLVYNDDLTWETTTTWNVGLDFGMFNQRLTLNVDAYYRKTTDLISTQTVPAGQNYDNAVMLNSGSLKNTGVEIAITGRPLQTKDWYLELGANVAYNKNKITELYNGRDVIDAGMQVGQNEPIAYHKVGLPANSFWVYQQVYDESGRPIMGCYVDRNADGVIDENDRYYYKNIVAPWTGGFNFKLAYKNWDIGTNFRFSIDNYVYNNIYSGKANTSTLYDSQGYYRNSTADIVSLGWTSYNYALSDYFVQNASFLKCDNITLGYNFSGLFKSEKYHGLSGRIYASCSNVFTVTDYKGLDPEQTSGKEDSTYPRSRTFLLGLNLDF